MTIAAVSSAAKSSAWESTPRHMLSFEINKRQGEPLVTEPSVSPKSSSVCDPSGIRQGNAMRDTMGTNVCISAAIHNLSNCAPSLLQYHELHYPLRAAGELSAAEHAGARANASTGAGGGAGAGAGTHPQADAEQHEHDRSSIGSDAPYEELRCVVAVIRHGDRSPKQKLKLETRHPDFLGLYDKYSANKRRGCEVKLKGREGGREGRG